MNKLAVRSFRFAPLSCSLLFTVLKLKKLFLRIAVLCQLIDKRGETETSTDDCQLFFPLSITNLAFVKYEASPSHQASATLHL